MFKDLSGLVFDRLHVVSRSYSDKNGNVFWKCICTCGVIRSFRGDRLRSKKTKSCGCLVLETKVSIPLYIRRAFSGMLQRCYNPNSIAFKNYGRRGIIVSDLWIGNCSNFFKYIGERPTNLYSIDRINNNGNYEPGNVKWSTKEEQQNNRNFNIKYYFNGKNLTLPQWAREVNINHRCLSSRLFNLGWGLEEALTTPARKRKSRFDL